MYRSSDLRLIPIDRQFTAELVSVIDQIEPRGISWEEFERCLREHANLGDSFRAVLRELDKVINEKPGAFARLEGWKPP
jgi:hypothetical protein